MKRYGINNDYFEPDKEHEHNYMLDTCIFNDLCDSSKSLSKLIQSIAYGFEYFYTNIQIREMQGMKDVGDDLIQVDWSGKEEKQEKFNNVISKLNVKKTGHMQVMSVKTSLADGSCHIIKDDQVEFVKKIRKSNMKHNEDMIIAESAIINGCILVTNDNSLYKKVKAEFPDKVINLEELANIIDAM